MSDAPQTDDPAATAEPATGPSVIRRYLKRLDDKPGVYRMLNLKSEVLYVGKARSLKSRVSSYANKGAHNGRITRMISETAAMEFITTATETEALLLESNLIKQLKPRYNVLLRDDKSFPQILIADHEYPQLRKHRGAERSPGRYFGPFASAGAVGRTVNQMERAFLLRTCTDSVFAGRTRPCLLFQIKRCAGPCTGEIDKPGYDALVADAIRFLEGRSTRVQDELARRMNEAAQAMDFERAAMFRDRLRAMAQIQGHQAVNLQKTQEADVFALHREGGQACVQVFFYRSRQNWGNHAYFPRTSAEMEDDELIAGFVAQFYGPDRPPPRMVLLSHAPETPDTLASALSQLAGRRVVLGVARRGEKREITDNAVRNAREALARRMAETASQGRNLAELAEALGLPEAPKRVEVYDNSHIQGAHAVGAMICAGPEGFLKSQYRKFNIRAEEAAGDDFAMMREVLERRFRRLVKEDPDREGETWPDLVLIDGGQGQVSAASGVLADLGVQDVTLLGVAKGTDRDAGKEVFHTPERRQFALPFRSPALYFVQRLRDEAHRFAIGAHRQKRAKAQTATALDEVPGIGPTRKRKLLERFGSAKAVSRAALADLKAVDGISDAMADAIYAFFHGER
ncbi:MAG: excinuclease ABC subunit UvrC [Paracoccaceae bacterium]